MAVVIFANDQVLKPQFPDSDKVIENFNILTSIAMLKLGLGMSDIRIAFISTKEFTQRVAQQPTIPAYEFYIGFDTFHHSCSMNFENILDRFFETLLLRFSLCQFNNKTDMKRASIAIKQKLAPLHSRFDSDIANMYNVGLPIDNLIFTAPNARELHIQNYIILLETHILNVFLNEISKLVNIQGYTQRSNFGFGGMIPDEIKEALSDQIQNGHNWFDLA